MRSRTIVVELCATIIAAPAESIGNGGTPQARIPKVLPNDNVSFGMRFASIEFSQAHYPLSVDDADTITPSHPCNFCGLSKSFSSFSLQDMEVSADQRGVIPTSAQVSSQNEEPPAAQRDVIPTSDQVSLQDMEVSADQRDVIPASAQVSSQDLEPPAAQRDVTATTDQVSLQDEESPAAQRDVIPTSDQVSSQDEEPPASLRDVMPNLEHELQVQAEENAMLNVQWPEWRAMTD